MNDTKNVLANDEVSTDIENKPSDRVTEVRSAELEQVCGGTTVGTDCVGGGGSGEL